MILPASKPSRGSCFYGWHKVFASIVVCLTNGHHKSRLWTSQEYLNPSGGDRTVSFAKPGDIYSLGIILHEIIERAGVWGLNTSTSEEEDKDYLEPKVTIYSISIEYS